MSSQKSGYKVGYARVITVDQTLDIQIKKLKEYGCRRIYCEKASGADTERKELRRLLDNLKEGQMVVVTRLDRLARSTFDLFSIVKTITDQKAMFYSLGEPWTNTNTSTGRLMLAVLGGLADVERDLIRTRTAEGRARAIEQGKRMGRPRRITEDQRQSIIHRRQTGESLQSIAESFGIDNSTVSRIARAQGCYQPDITKIKKRGRHPPC